MPKLKIKSKQCENPGGVATAFLKGSKCHYILSSERIFSFQASILQEERSDLWQAECVCSWANIGVCLSTATHTDGNEAKLHGFVPEFSSHHSGLGEKKYTLRRVLATLFLFD